MGRNRGRAFEPKTGGDNPFAPDPQEPYDPEIFVPGTRADVDITGVGEEMARLVVRPMEEGLNQMSATIITGVKYLGRVSELLAQQNEVNQEEKKDLRKREEDLRLREEDMRRRETEYCKEKEEHLKVREDFRKERDGLYGDRDKLRSDTDRLRQEQKGVILILMLLVIVLAFLLGRQ
ncbi:hypothetical protein QBC40DRAFT_249455 [Triangularia verruculosa]|uniref:Uncharacterized protein n=1 Tax=Triangularia verruculosa TaxID=2587418 RepID=A0AAN6XST7_9PEZI|nr:hypothetical protein QBC40DRAFT_249455 [Triangularia verruculosa]